MPPMGLIAGMAGAPPAGPGTVISPCTAAGMMQPSPPDAPGTLSNDPRKSLS